MGIKIKIRKKKAITFDEWKFTNQNWKRVLAKIVNYAPNRYGRGKSNYGEDHRLVKHLKITPYELTLIMAFLEDQGLIEYDQSEHNWINLTAKGFDVSMQVQNQVRAFRTTFTLIVFTAIIAFSAFVSLLNAPLSWGSYPAIIIFVLGLGYILWKVSRREI